MTRLAVARLWFCSNSFLPRRTRSEDFQQHEWTSGAAALSASAEGGELEGLKTFLAQRPDWDATLLRCASAPPGGPLSAEVFGMWMAEVEDALRRGRFDAVYLSLHGACQAEGDPAADITILRRVRAIVGHTPVVASFDIRANLSEETAILLDGASANRAWPQGDGSGAALRALTLLESILSGRARPVGVLARVPMVMNDALLPDALGEFWAGTGRILQRPILDASVFGGFAWGDSPYSGPSALVWADRDAGAAREMAAYLALSLDRWRARPAPDLVPTSRLLTFLPADRPGSPPAPERPLLILDPGDDPASGGTMDTPALLQSLVASQAGDRPAGRVLFAGICDPLVAADARRIGSGGTWHGTLGGQTTRLYGAGPDIEATILSAEHLSHVLLRTANVDIVVTDARPVGITPALLAGFGVSLADYAILAIKGGAAARAAFAGAVSGAVMADCPGPCSPDLLRLPYHYVPAVRRQPVATATLSARDTGRHGASDQPGADQPDQRYEERRANAQQKRSEAFGAQRR